MENLSEKTKLILVDNNEQMRNNIKSQLKDDQMEVVADFGDAISALNYIKENEVDVIVSDIVLPNIDGYEFMEALNKDGCQPIGAIRPMTSLHYWMPLSKIFLNRIQQKGLHRWWLPLWNTLLISDELPLENLPEEL